MRLTELAEATISPLVARLVRRAALFVALGGGWTADSVRRAMAGATP